MTAAFAGIFYLRNSANISGEIKLFVYYLILIVVLELYGLIPIWAWLEDYQILSFYENSLFRRNLWWANTLRIISTLCITWIFVKSLTRENLQKKFKWLLILYSLFSILRFSFSGNFFAAYDPFVDILGVFIILTAIGCYYFQVLISDEILNFFEELKFYISVGIIIWSVCVIPLNIYSNFFSSENLLFIELSRIVLMYTNIFLYSFYTIGFYIDYRCRKAL